MVIFSAGGGRFSSNWFWLGMGLFYIRTRKGGREADLRGRERKGLAALAAGGSRLFEDLG